MGTGVVGATFLKTVGARLLKPCNFYCQPITHHLVCFLVTRDLSCCYGNPISNTCLPKNDNMNKLLIFTSYTKFMLNSLRNNAIAMTLLITDIFGCHDTVKVSNDVIFKHWLWRHNFFVKFE